jgi:hypothetical protein
MPAEFIDITIGALDEAESFKRSGQLWEKVYFLSALVPERWGQLFAEVWAGAQFVPKRHARIEKGELYTICLAEEVNGQLMDYLRMAVLRTNAEYRAEQGGRNGMTE